MTAVEAAPANRLPKGYVCYRAPAPFPIDGRLDKLPWQAVPWTEDFVDIEGDSKPPPPLRTRAKLLWDAQFLYIGAQLQEPHVWATLTEHDSVIFQDPDFEVFIDPDGDNHNYYEIEINALNTVWDLRLVRPYRDGGPALNSWEIPGLRSAVHIDGTLNAPADTDRGWSVEMAVPWAVLAEFAGRRTPPDEGDQWRVNFSRVEWDTDIRDGRYEKVPGRPEHNWVWSPQGVIDMHRPERWGCVQFSSAPVGTTAFLPDPTAQAREHLMEIYYAQREYQLEHGHWADALSGLALPSPVGSAPRLALTEDGFVATLDCPIPGRPPARLHVRQDSRLWAE